jgi:hypothetical protein
VRLAPQGRQAMRAPCCDRVVPVLGPCWGPGLRPVGPERLARVVLAGARLAAARACLASGALVLVRGDLCPVDGCGPLLRLWGP